jgi:predicted benzoate:H+ symporter BenE
MFTYLIFDAGGLGCDVLHDVMYLLYWAWTDPQAAAIATTHNLSPVSAAVRAALITALWRLRCGGSSLLNNILVNISPRCASGTNVCDLVSKLKLQC